MSQDADKAYQLIERLGLPTALLIGAAYFGFTLVVEPLAKTYREAIDRVAITSEELERAIAEDNKADGERVKEIAAAIKALENKIDAAILRLKQ